MSRTTFALALAAMLSAAPALGAQQQPPAGGPGQPPAGAPGRRAPGRRSMPGGDRQFGPMGSGGMGPGAPMMAGGGSPAEMLLAHTGELKLTDQQVVRLAAIARRTDDRRRAFRTRMDSLRATFRPDSTRPRARFAPGGAAGGPLATQLTQLREQARADLRDALTVLTPDQQAQAWEMAARRGRGGMMGPAARMRRGGMARGQRRMRRPGRGEEEQ